jgi:hypothetical protein
MNQEKGKKLVLLMVGGNFTHGPFNVACMQIMSGLKQASSVNTIFLAIIEVKAC